MEQLLWESILESINTVMVIMEWIMFELARNFVVQKHLYKKVVDVTSGQNQTTFWMVKENDILSILYLNVLIKEYFFKYTPIPLLPPCYVDKDTILGVYDFPKGWQVDAILIY
jgi:cytochrome P450